MQLILSIMSRAQWENQIVSSAIMTPCQETLCKCSGLAQRKKARIETRWNFPLSVWIADIISAKFMHTPSQAGAPASIPSMSRLSPWLIIQNYVKCFKTLFFNNPMVISSVSFYQRKWNVQENECPSAHMLCQTANHPISETILHYKGNSFLGGHPLVTLGDYSWLLNLYLILLLLFIVVCTDLVHIGWINEWVNNLMNTHQLELI